MNDDAVATVFPPFAVSRAAIEAIEALGGAVRVDLEDGGCCGTAYAFSLVDAEDEQVQGDARYGCPGAWLFVTEAVGEVLAGATLDYGARLRPPRFRVPESMNEVWRVTFRARSAASSPPLAAAESRLRSTDM